MVLGLRRLSVVVLVGAMCCAAWAGTLTVKVENAGAPVDGAIVRVEPGGPHGTTNADGKWADTVPAGDYRVIVWKTIAGTLRGGIVDLTMPAGDKDVSLSLQDAVWTYNLFPYAVGNSWQYDYRHSGSDGRWTCTWREKVERALTVAGEPAVVLSASKDMVPEWEEIRASTREGFVLFTQQHGADTIKFDPPLRLGALLPLNYEWVATATAHHSDGSPDESILLRCKLVGFERVTVPAGTFDTAKLAVVMTMGRETNELTVWAAHNVGIVRQIEVNPERKNLKLLEEYTIRGLPMRPLIPIGPIHPIIPRP